MINWARASVQFVTTLACARGQAPHKARLDSAAAAMNVPLVADSDSLS